MKQKLAMIAGSAMLGSILAYSLIGVGQSLASDSRDDDEYEPEFEYHEEYEPNKRRVSARQDPLYVEECGSCHMAYPPGLLPAASWQKIMAGLEDHFSENAELDADSRRVLEDYLVSSSDQRSYRKLFRNLGEAVPLRITELPYFVRKHDEIPARFVTGNDQVRSFSQCDACHRSADRGKFDEDDIFIAGFGRWDD